MSNTTLNIADTLIAEKVSPEKYGSEQTYQNHLIQQYSLYVEMADKISTRRQTASSFFLSINTAIIAFVGYWQSGGSPEAFISFRGLVALSGVVLCYMWYRLIKSYRDLNSAKFKVIHEIERHLPLSPYDAEWEAIGRGENSKLYLPFTHIETGVPWVFMALHAITIALPLPWAQIYNTLISFIQCG